MPPICPLPNPPRKRGKEKTWPSTVPTTLADRLRDTHPSCHCLRSRARYRYAGPVRDRSARLSVLSVPVPPACGEGRGAREHARIDAAAEELAVKEILRTHDAV